MSSIDPMDFPEMLRRVFRLGFDAGGEAGLQALLAPQHFDADEACERAWRKSVARDMAEAYRALDRVA